MCRKLILIVAAWALGITAQAQLRFGGFFVVNSEEFVALSEADGRIAWVKVGEMFGDYRVRKLDRSADTLYVTLGQEKLVVPMSKQKVLKEESKPALVRLPDSPGKPTASVKSSKVISRFPASDLGERSTEGLNWDWINSDKNPMRKLPIQPSISEQDAWPNLSESAKEDLVELYRQHGWHITVELNEAGVGVRYRKATPPSETDQKMSVSGTGR